MRFGRVDDIVMAIWPYVMDCRYHDSHQHSWYHSMSMIITLQCGILARTSLFSPAYIRFWPTVRHFLTHCTSLVGPVAMPACKHLPPSWVQCHWQTGKKPKNIKNEKYITYHFWVTFIYQSFVCNMNYCKLSWDWRVNVATFMRLLSYRTAASSAASSQDGY